MYNAIRKITAITLILAAILLLCSCGLLPRSQTSAPVDADETEKGFVVYFIDVGQADAALIICDGAAMLIDGGNVADSDLVYTFLKDRGISHLEYIVASHGHEDHAGGLAGALNAATAGIALSPVAEYDTTAFSNFIRYLDEQDIRITVPRHGDEFGLGSADVHIIGPVKNYSSHNDMSLVIKIAYGNTSFLFAGDAERASELDMLEAGCDISATVLKSGHHGSDTSTTYPFLREVMPQYAVISCGRNNQYGHPSDDVLSRFRDADVTVFRTDLQGTITCTSDGQTVSFTVERNAGTVTNPEEPSSDEQHYIGNINTRRFHRPSCSGLPQEQNRIILYTLEEAISEGFEPCGRCNP